MNKFFSGFLALAMALAMVMPAASPALADSSGDSRPQLSSLPSLMIKSPNTVEAGQTATVTVFSKHGHEAVAGAPVYILKIGGLVTGAGAANYAALPGEYEALAEAKGTLFGTTGSDGTVKGNLSETGRFMLVATKDGYIPGFARLTVTLAVRVALNIKAPGSAEVNKPVTISVTGRYTGHPVATAAVYGRPVTAPNVPPVTAPADNGTATAGYYPDPAISPVTTAEAQILIGENNDRSFLIGYTNSNGEVQFTFKGPGLYSLVAIKDGYLPGGARINIKATQPSKALEINALFNISAGQPATLKVWEKGANQPVAAAAVYVLKTGDSGDIKAMPPTANNDKAQGEANRAREKGTLAGYTDENGQVVYTFSSYGQYVLAAFKDGYSPAFSYITYILPVSKKSLTLTAPAEAYAGAAVNIGTADGGGNALGRVAIYSLRMDVVAQAATALQSAARPDAAAREKYGPILRERSSFMGYTDDNGQLNVKFSRTGAFMLLAIRDGYLPDFARINIKPAPPPVPAPAPLPAPVPQSENATITE